MASIRRKAVRAAAVLSIGLLMDCSSAAAQVVTAIGMGETRDMALSDAKRNAVEEVVGAFVDSKSLAEMAVVQLDQIYTKSQGFVKKITVLEESERGGTYTVKASIDVDTNPDAALMDQLTMLMMLNDPQIAVVVLKEGGMGHDDYAESVVMEKLVGMGFSHVIDAAHVSSLQDMPLLSRVYNGEVGFPGSADRAAEYLVLMKEMTGAYNVNVRDYATGGLAATQLMTAKTNLAGKIIKYDTGDVIDSYVVSGQGIDNASELAQVSSMINAAEGAAKKVEEKFKKFAARATSQGIQLHVYAENYDRVEQLANELRGLTGVQGVYIRSHSGNKALIEIDSSEKPEIIVRMLRAKSKLGIFVEGISGSAVEMAVS